MELSGTIPLTELPAENKVLNGHTGGSVPVDVDAFIAHQAADGEFCLSLWLRFVNSDSERGLQHNTISLVQTVRRFSCLLPVFNNRALSPFVTRPYSFDLISLWQTHSMTPSLPSSNVRS